MQTVKNCSPLSVSITAEPSFQCEKRYANTMQPQKQVSRLSTIPFCITLHTLMVHVYNPKTFAITTNVQVNRLGGNNGKHKNLGERETNIFL
jgi:hypothetical protein